MPLARKKKRHIVKKEIENNPESIRSDDIAVIVAQATAATTVVSHPRTTDDHKSEKRTGQSDDIKNHIGDDDTVNKVHMIMTKTMEKGINSEGTMTAKLTSLFPQVMLATMPNAVQ
jgi:hypothetical protein